MAAINRAQGFTEDAGISRVRLIRANKETIYDLRKINPDGSNNPDLMDGDQIIVPLLSALDAALGLLRPGDTVLIELKKPAGDVHKITATYTISNQGTIKLPMLEQEIPALGISVSTLTRRVEAAYMSAGIYSAPIINVI